MKKIKFRARMKNKNATVHFTLQDLVNPKALFSIRELLIPWLLEGNQPDRWIGRRDENGQELYEKDIVKNDSGRICEVIWFESPVFSCWDLHPLNTEGSSSRDWNGWKIIDNVKDNPKMGR